MGFSPRRVTDLYAVHGQLQPDDMALVWQQGYRSVINNRPDGEEAGQPCARDLAEAAQAAGLNYVHIPVSGEITLEQCLAMREALAALPQPVLAFCRSGARSTRIWAHAMQDRKAMAEILDAAAAAGCDVAALMCELKQGA